MWLLWTEKRVRALPQLAAHWQMQCQAVKGARQNAANHYAARTYKTNAAPAEGLIMPVLPKAQATSAARLPALHAVRFADRAAGPNSNRLQGSDSLHIVNGCPSPLAPKRAAG
jgi:hypothetical protein